MRRPTRRRYPSSPVEIVTELSSGRAGHTQQAPGETQENRLEKQRP